MSVLRSAPLRTGASGREVGWKLSNGEAAAAVSSRRVVRPLPALSSDVSPGPCSARAWPRERCQGDGAPSWPGRRLGLAACAVSASRAPPPGKRSRSDDVAGALPGVADCGNGGKGATTTADPPPAGWVGPGWGRAFFFLLTTRRALARLPKGVALRPRSRRPGLVGGGRVRQEVRGPEGLPGRPGQHPAWDSSGGQCGPFRRCGAWAVA